jgi:hypothetical protein
MPQVIAAVVFAVKVVVAFAIAHPIAFAVLRTLGTYVAMRALSPKPKSSANGAWRGDNLQLQVSATIPRGGALGKCGVAGSLVTFQSWGTNNEYGIILIALADHKCEDLVGAWWNGKRVTFDAAAAKANGAAGGTGDGAAVSEATIGGTPHLWITFYDGDWNQSADAQLISNSGGRWTSNDRGRGVCYVRIKAYTPSSMSSTDFQTAFPSGLSGLVSGWVWELKGYRPYDRREDGSAGGTGSQRYNDQTTLTYDNNCAVLTENLLRGFFVEDTVASVGSRKRDTFYGLGLDDADLPYAENVAAMNACDEAVTLRAGGTEPRYTANGVISCDQPCETVLQDLQGAMAGKIAFGPGRWLMLPGVPMTPVGSNLTDDDIRIDGPYSFKDHTPLGEATTAIFARFADPKQYYQATPLPPRINTTAEAAVGRKGENLDLIYVTSQSQGQRCMNIYLNRAAMEKRATIALAPEQIVLEPGDWKTWASSRPWGTVTFEVVQPNLRLSDKDALMSVLDLREISDSVFAWTPATDELDYVSPTSNAGGSGTLPSVANQG